MKISIIVARSRNKVIGKDNTIPWHIPEDLKYFKEKTIGKSIIMGRKTFESIGRPLPCRVNIIVSSDKNYNVAGATVVNSFESAIELVKTFNRRYTDEIFVVGGQSLYEKALPIADRLYITEVDIEVEDGDTFFNFEYTKTCGWLLDDSNTKHCPISDITLSFDRYTRTNYAN